MHKASDKFEAFGNFVTASLQDLPENKSLEIIEKFTNEIVRALIENWSWTACDNTANKCKSGIPLKLLIDELFPWRFRKIVK